MTGHSIAIVSGGGNGIGLACAQRLTADGYRVVIADLDTEAGEIAARVTPGATFIRCDVTKHADIDQVVARACELGNGRLRALVNNAGQTSRARFADCDQHAWRMLHEVNLDSVYYMTQACLDPLIAGGGAVVSLSSVAGLVGTEGLAAYSSTKAAIIALTRSLALEYGDRVRLNAVCPGDIETRMMARVLADEPLRRAMADRIPARRFGQPEEVANVIAWLLSDESSYVNGAAIPVDGGLTAGLRAVS
jgi:meso-butanediol dehydrogenase / (S,S)-butanediol dehydrogenase / diacetyl reductase